MTSRNTPPPPTTSVFDLAPTLGLPDLRLLDIGGGFPGGGHDHIDGVAFPEIATVLRGALDTHFPETGVDGGDTNAAPRIIAEPGRFYVSTSHTLAVNIIGRRLVEAGSSTIPDTNLPGTSKDNFMYYVNDGIYGSFNCLLYDHATVNPEVLRVHSAGSAYANGVNGVNGVNAANAAASTKLREGRIAVAAPPHAGGVRATQQQCAMLSSAATAGAGQFKSSVWGQTCDGLDCIAKDVDLPELNVGDWLMFSDMGAYTVSAASSFNGFEKPSSFFL